MVPKEPKRVCRYFLRLVRLADSATHVREVDRDLAELRELSQFPVRRTPALKTDLRVERIASPSRLQPGPSALRVSSCSLVPQKLWMLAHPIRLARERRHSHILGYSISLRESWLALTLLALVRVAQLVLGLPIQAAE